MKMTSGKNSVSLRHISLELSPSSHQPYRSSSSSRAGQEVKAGSYATSVLVVTAVASEWGSQWSQACMLGKRQASQIVGDLLGSSWMQDNRRGLAKLSTCLGLTRGCDVHSRD